MLVKWQAITRKELLMSTNNYEVILVANASQTDEECNQVFGSFKDIITNAGGEVKFESDWGRRKLSYEINKMKHGVYRLFFITGNGETIRELERQVSYSDDVIKHFVTCVEDLEKEYNDFEALKADPSKNAKLVDEAIGA